MGLHNRAAAINFFSNQVLLPIIPSINQVKVNVQNICLLLIPFLKLNEISVVNGEHWIFLNFIFLVSAFVISHLLIFQSPPQPLGVLMSITHPYCTNGHSDRPLQSGTLSTFDTEMHWDQPTFDFLIIHNLKPECVCGCRCCFTRVDSQPDARKTCQRGTKLTNAT